MPFSLPLKHRQRTVLSEFEKIKKERIKKIMDKETLSNYGWITICVLVIAVMVALATPFGSYIKSAVENTTQGLGPFFLCFCMQENLEVQKIFHPLYKEHF